MLVSLTKLQNILTKIQGTHTNARNLDRPGQTNTEKIYFRDTALTIWAT